MKNKMSEQEKIDKEGMHEAAQAFRCIQNAKCKAEVFSFFVANIRNEKQSHKHNNNDSRVFNSKPIHVVSVSIRN